MPRVEKTVFISYRRTNFPWALAVYQNLTYQGYDVFFDYLSIPSGDFEQVILENIRTRAHFIVILTPSALERCSEPGDWLRREIETALETRRNIVPMMLEGFSFSSPSIYKHLSGNLATLQRYQALSVPAEYFDEAMGRLCKQYLNVPLEAVLHPASDAAREAAQEQQLAVKSSPEVKVEELTAQEWFEQGKKQWQAGEYEESIRYYSEAIRLDPNLAYAYNNRGASYADLGQHERAIQDYDKAIELDPKYALAYNNRGLSYAGLRQYKRAIEDFDKAIELDPKYAAEYYNRGNSYADLGQHERAIQDYDKAIELDPKYAAA